MKIDISRTGRGFMFLEFRDYNEEACFLQESSLADEKCVWLGRSDQRMHLTQSQVRALLPILEFFVDSGGLPEKLEES